MANLPETNAPVAWYRDKQGMMTFIEHEPVPHIDGSGWTPLYAAPASNPKEPADDICGRCKSPRACSYHGECKFAGKPADTAHIGEAGKTADCPPDAEQLAHQMQFGADMAAKYSRVCESLERECSDADAICQALGMDIEQFRTEGGSLHLARIKNRIADLAASKAMAADTGIVQELPKPFWHAVVSDPAPIVNKAIRSEEVAHEYAAKCHDYPGVRVEQLFTADQMREYARAAQAVTHAEISLLRQAIETLKAARESNASIRAALSSAAQGVQDKTNQSSIDRMVHDFPILNAFYEKHGMPMMTQPSCFKCGSIGERAITHAELPNMYICKGCCDAPVLPEGWVPLRIEFEPGYSEDVAFGPQIMMDRLKKWLDNYFAMRLVAPVLQGEREAFEAWAHEHGFDVAKRTDGSYFNVNTACVWEAWQARASSAQIQEQKPNVNLAEPSTTATDTRFKPSQPISDYFIDRLLEALGEMPDRDSPADFPEAYVVTGKELREYIRMTEERFAENEQSTLGPV